MTRSVVDLPITRTAGATGERAALMIVGEAPGRPDLHQGPRERWTIFRRLEEWFRRAGFRERAALEAAFVNASEGWPAVEQVIVTAQPSLIITLGRQALTLVTGVVDYDFVRDAGRVVEDRHFATPVLPLPHPSGRNRLFNDRAGREALAKDLEALSHVRVWKALEKERS